MKYSQYFIYLRELCFVVVVESPNCVQFFVTSWTAAHQASTSLTISQSLPKFMSIASVMPYSHLILWCPRSFPASGTFPMSQLFISNDQNTGASTSASILLMSFQSWFPLKLTGLISWLSKGLSEVFSSTTVQRHQFFDILPSLQSSSHSRTWSLGRPEPWLYGLLSAK